MNSAIPKPDTIRLQARRGSGKLHVLPSAKPVQRATVGVPQQFIRAHDRANEGRRCA